MGGQHINTITGDHGLKHDGDAIVIRCSFRPSRAGGSSMTRAMPSNPGCIARSALGASGQADPTSQQNDREGTTMTAQPTPEGAWRMTFLLFLFMLVNFADKIVVGLAGVRS